MPAAAAGPGSRQPLTRSGVPAPHALAATTRRACMRARRLVSMTATSHTNLKQPAPEEVFYSCLISLLSPLCLSPEAVFQSAFAFSRLFSPSRVFPLLLAPLRTQKTLSVASSRHRPRPLCPTQTAPCHPTRSPPRPPSPHHDTARGALPPPRSSCDVEAYAAPLRIDSQLTI